jgi:DNA-binding MarR family transcriptional regulator
MATTRTDGCAVPGVPLPGDAEPPQAPDAQRETLLELFEEAQRRMMARPDASSAGEWLRLDLSTNQLKLLLWLCATGAQPMGQIARILGITMPSATALVDRLVEAGLAEREHDTADRRVVRARASTAGVALMTRFREVGRERMRHILGYVPDEALAALVTGMRALTQAVARADAESAGR